MDQSLDDVAFLANSENRIKVLRHLVDGPHSRHVILERTGISRVTLGRVLDGLEARHWITQRGQVCDITPLGRWVVEEFTELCEMLAAEQRLRAVAEWFPEPGYGFHPSRLADAEITRISPADASAPITKLVQEFEVGGPIRAFSFAITSQFLEAGWRHVVDGSVRFEWVFSTEVLTVLQENPEMARQSREMLETNRAAYYHYEGDIPYVVILSGGHVNLRLADDEGAATALIQSDDDEVRSWAESTFEEYRKAATPVEPTAFTG